MSINVSFYDHSTVVLVAARWQRTARNGCHHRQPRQPWVHADLLYPPQRVRTPAFARRWPNIRVSLPFSWRHAPAKTPLPARHTPLIAPVGASAGAHRARPVTSPPSLPSGGTTPTARWGSGCPLRAGTPRPPGGLGPGPDPHAEHLGRRPRRLPKVTLARYNPLAPPCLQLDQPAGHHR
jgi:hypothetical protein